MGEIEGKERFSSRFLRGRKEILALDANITLTIT